MDDFGLLIGRHYTALPTLSDSQVSEVMLDSLGRMIIAGRFLAGSDSYAANDSGLSMLAVRNDAGGPLSGVADGEYSPLQVDSQGRLVVNAQVTVDIGAEKLEDAAHVSGDTGNFVLAVRSDVRPVGANVDASGDYASFFVNASGELYVKDSDSLDKLTEIDTVLDSIKVDTGAMVTDLAAIEAELLDQGLSLDAMVTDLAAIETELLDQGTTLDGIKTDTAAIVVDVAAIEAELLDQGTTLDSISTEISSMSHAEDSAHVSGDVGMMPLAVRADTDGSLVDADGDYSPLQVDSNGMLKVSASIAALGSEQFSVTDALAGGGDGLETITAVATPWVTVASLSHTSGTAYIYGYQWACDQNAQVRLVSDVSGTVTYYKTSINSSANPGMSEHFSDQGRIEIAGVANQEIRLQIKKRSDKGGDANGSGSIHIRTI